MPAPRRRKSAFHGEDAVSQRAQRASVSGKPVGQCTVMTGEPAEAAVAEEEAEGVSGTDRKLKGQDRAQQSAKRPRPLHSESDSDSGSDHPQQPRKRGARPGLLPFRAPARWVSHALSCPCTVMSVPGRPGFRTKYK